MKTMILFLSTVNAVCAQSFVDLTLPAKDTAWYEASDFPGKKKVVIDGRLSFRTSSAGILVAIVRNTGKDYSNILGDQVYRIEGDRLIDVDRKLWNSATALKDDPIVAIINDGNTTEVSPNWGRVRALIARTGQRLEIAVKPETSGKVLTSSAVEIDSLEDVQYMLGISGFFGSRDKTWLVISLSGLNNEFYLFGPFAGGTELTK